MYRTEDWLLLFVFLVCIILTVQVIMMIYNRVLQATRRKREADILDELIRIANSKEERAPRLERILKLILEVFPTYKIEDCVLLQRDQTEIIRVQASISQAGKETDLSFDEQDYASWVTTYGQDICLYESLPHVLSTSSHFTQRAVLLASMEESASGHYVRFLPLKVGLRTVGVLRLSIHNDAPFFVYHDVSEKDVYQDARASFFSTLLSQLAVQIEGLPVTEPVGNKEEATPL